MTSISFTTCHCLHSLRGVINHRLNDAKMVKENLIPSMEGNSTTLYMEPENISVGALHMQDRLRDLDKVRRDSKTMVHLNTPRHSTTSRTIF